MKSKILLSTLLGGALLAGCTADDALEVNKVAQNVNPASPVFTVSFDDNDDPSMRALMTPDGMTWQSIDRMSLYHGGGNITATTDSWDVNKGTDDQGFLTNSGKVKNFDAIYTQGTVGAEGQAVFATQSMVTEGLAIMVYPADTAYTQEKSYPVIEIDAKQNDKTKHLTPFVSEVLKITKHGDLNVEKGEKTHSAGYGRQYDLRLRRIGAQLRLKLNAINDEKLKAITDGDDVEDVDFRRVSIKTADETKKPFTTKMWVKVGLQRTQLDKNGNVNTSVTGDDRVGVNTIDHPYWKYSPWIEPTEDADAKTNEISTSDVDLYDDVPTAFFTLLPTEDRPGDTYNRAISADGEPLFGAVTITVDTRYGYVEVEDDATDNNDKKWSNRQGADAEKINTGLAKIFTTLFPTQSEDAATYPMYRGQTMAGSGARTLQVDMSKLEMNNLHITNEKHLLDAIKVYHALYDEKDKDQRTVTFILDGDEENETFELTEAGLAAMAAEMTSTATLNYGLKFQACQDNGEKCTIVKVTNTGSTAEEVPSYLKFEGTYSVKLQLDKAWKYTSVTAKNNAVDESKKKNLINVSEIEVLAGASLNLENYIAVKTNQLTNGITVDYNATVTVNKKETDVSVKLTNHGTIVIGTNGELRADNGGVIENCYEKQAAADKTQITGLTVTKPGTIENSGILGIVDKSTGKVNNYGVIDIKTYQAATLVSTNAMDGAKASVLYGGNASTTGDNYIGTILLDNANPEMTDVFGNRGFLKKTINGTPTAENVGDLANYIILTAGCDVTKDDIEKDVPGLPNASKNGNITGVKYIEVATTEIVTFKSQTEAVYLEGLIVPAGSTVYVERNAELVIHDDNGTIMIDGTITNAGNVRSRNNTGKNQLVDTVYDGYFGKSTKKVTNVGATPTV